LKASNVIPRNTLFLFLALTLSSCNGDYIAFEASGICSKKLDINQNTSDDLPVKKSDMGDDICKDLALKRFIIERKNVVFDYPDGRRFKLKKVESLVYEHADIKKCRTVLLLPVNGKTDDYTDHTRVLKNYFVLPYLKSYFDIKGDLIIEEHVITSKQSLDEFCYRNVGSSEVNN